MQWVVSGLWFLLLIGTGRFVSFHDRKRVRETISIFSSSMVVSTGLLLTAMSFEYISENKISDDWVGHLILFIVKAELDLPNSVIIFFGGCGVIFGPGIITAFLCFFLNCSSQPETLNLQQDDESEFMKSVKSSSAVSDLALWWEKTRKWRSAFYWLSLFLVKSFVACAAVLDAVHIAGTLNGWASEHSMDKHFKVLGSTAAIMSLAIISSFILDATQKLILDKAALKVIRVAFHQWLVTHFIYRWIESHIDRFYNILKARLNVCQQKIVSYKGKIGFRR